MTQNMLYPLGIIASFLLIGCSTLQLQPADFSWATEEIVDIKLNGTVESKRYSTTFNINALLIKEFADDADGIKKTTFIRVLCDKAGYYFITAPKFKNVYVFKQDEGSLIIQTTISISPEKGMVDPKMDQKDSYIELINGFQKLKLTKNGIQQ